MESYEPVDESGYGPAPESHQFTQVVLLVVEGLGVGALPDAEDYRDRGAATLQNVSKYVGGLGELAQLQWLGLGNTGASVRGVEATELPGACTARLARASGGSDVQGAIDEMLGSVLSGLRSEEVDLDLVVLGKAGEYIGEGLATAAPEGASLTRVMNNVASAMNTPIRGLAVAVIGTGEEESNAQHSPFRLARLLSNLDKELGTLLGMIPEKALLMVVGANGRDTTLGAARGTTREYVPLLAYSPSDTAGLDLGTRASLGDIGATIANNFGLPEPEGTESFYAPLLS